MPGDPLQTPNPEPSQPAGVPDALRPSAAGASQPVSALGAQLAPDAPLPRYHVHHSYMWLGSLRTGGIVFVALLASVVPSMLRSLFAPGQSGAFEMLLTTAVVAGALLVSVVIAAAYQLLSYKHLYYELGPEEFNLYSGILNKKRVHVPYRRIQSVDQRASLLQRVFGVCTVNVDTAGGAANKAVVVPYVRKSQAEELRRELFGRKQYALAVQAGATPAQAAQLVRVHDGAAAGEQGNVLDAPAEMWEDVRGVFGGEAVDTGRVTYEYGLTNKELILTGLSNNTAFVLVAIGIVAGLVQVLEPLMTMFARQTAAVIGSVSQAGYAAFGPGAIALAALGFLGVCLVMWLISGLTTCISYGGFRARRRANRIEVERGLLQHQFQGVDVDRVQSVTVRQSVIRRLFGYCEISLGKIDVTFDGMAGDQQQSSGLSQGLVIHPFVKLDRVPEILAGIIPEYAGVPARNTPVSPVALRRAVIRRGIVQGFGFWLAVAVALTQVLLNVLLSPVDPAHATALVYINAVSVALYAVAAVSFALEVVGAVLWARGSGFSYNREFMQIANGGLARETVSFPRRKIQFGCVRSNPLQRRAGTATIRVRTASGVSGTTEQLIDVRADDAQAWLGWLEPRGNVVE